MKVAWYIGIHNDRCSRQREYKKEDHGILRGYSVMQLHPWFR